MFKFLQKSPEQQALKSIDDDFRDFARYFAEKVELMVGNNKFATDISAGFQTQFGRAIWSTLTARSFEKLQESNPERFTSVIQAQFQEGATHNDDADILQIDLDLSDDTPHPIHYFTDFENLPGYEALRTQCASYGMDFDLVLDPLEQDMARIGFVLWSIDRRPLLSCLKSPQPAAGYEQP